MVHKKNKWKLKNKLEVEDWFSIIFAVTMDARGTMATTFVVTEKGKSNEND